MATKLNQIYVNLAVKDVEKAKKFYQDLGFTFNLKYTDANAACVEVGENIYAMLLAEPFFKTFTQDKELCNAKTHTEVLVCMSCTSRAQVDEITAKAVVAGGSAIKGPNQMGPMYGHGFEDLDGHIWELLYMDPHGCTEAHGDAAACKS